MKKLLLLLILSALSNYAFCQKIDSKQYYLEGDYLCDLIPIVNGKINYMDIIPIEGSSKETLYYQAKIWFANTFNSAQSVIQLDDALNGKLIGKGSVLISDQGEYLKFTVSISIKDGRYKYDFYDFFMLSWTGIIPSLKNEVFEKRFQKTDCNKKKDYSYITVINKNMTKLIDSLNQEMKNNTSETDNDW